MADPKTAFTDNPYAECEVHLTFTGRAAEHVRRRARHAARGAGRGVRQGSLRAAHRGPRHHPGRRRGVGDPTASACATTRGARATGRRRGTTAGSRQRRPRLRLHGQPRREEGRAGTRGGFVWENGTLHLCDDVEITTETRGDEHYHEAHRGRRCGRAAPTGSGASPASVMSLIPLRNRRQTPDGEWLQTRISEAMTVGDPLRRLRRPGRLRHVGVPRPDRRRRPGRSRGVSAPCAPCPTGSPRRAGRPTGAGSPSPAGPATSATRPRT
jgi:hypothetical protein